MSVSFTSLYSCPMYAYICCNSSSSNSADLGSYFGNCTSGGNNYEACIVTAENALNDYPYSDMREKFAILVMKSKYELANMSIEAKAPALSGCGGRVLRLHQ